MQNKENKKEKKKNKNANGIYILLTSIVLIILVAVTIGGYFYLEKQNEEKELAYTELIQQIEEEKIEEIEMTSGSTTAKVKYKNVEDKKVVSIPDTEAFVEFIQTRMTERKKCTTIKSKTSQYHH